MRKVIVKVNSEFLEKFTKRVTTLARYDWK